MTILRTCLPKCPEWFCGPNVTFLTSKVSRTVLGSTRDFLPSKVSRTSLWSKRDFFCLPKRPERFWITSFIYCLPKCPERFWSPNVIFCIVAVTKMITVPYGMLVFWVFVFCSDIQKQSSVSGSRSVLDDGQLEGLQVLSKCWTMNQSTDLTILGVNTLPSEPFIFDC